MGKRKTTSQTDSTYFLKLVLYLILGSQWVFITDESSLDWQIPLPVGLLLGILFASHEHFQLDRKIEYALLLVAAVIGFWANIGVFITIS